MTLVCCLYILCQEMAYIQAYSLLSDPEYINIVYICLFANYLNKILFKPIYFVSIIWKTIYTDNFSIIIATNLDHSMNVASLGVVKSYTCIYLA